MPTKNLAIMFTDIKGFTARSSDETRAGLSNLLTKHERLLTPVFSYFSGTIVKTIGDAFLVYFESPTDAVLCGLTIQEVLRQYNSFAQDKEKINVRVAINVGDVELRDGDIFGEPVNLASRLEGITEAGEVYFTEAVFLSMNRKEVPSAEVGERTFKGIPYSVRVYKVTRDPNSDQAKRIAEAVRLTKDGPVIRGLREPQKKAPWVAISVAASLLVIAAAAVVIVFFIKPDPVKKEKEKAAKLLEQKQYLSALEVLDPLLRKDLSDAALRDMALRAAEAHLEFLKKERTLKEEYEWLKKEVEDRPYLESMLRRLPAMETELLIIENIQGGNGYKRPQEVAGELIRKYPKDAEVPYVAAEVIRRTHIVESVMWMYEESMKRGGHVGERHIFDSCVSCFERCEPTDGWLETPRRIVAEYFEKAGYEWAKKALDEENENGYLSAWKILESKKDPSINDQFFLAVKGILERKEIDRNCDIILKENDKKRCAHVAALVRDMLKDYTEGNSKIPAEAVAKLQATLDVMSERTR